MARLSIQVEPVQVRNPLGQYARTVDERSRKSLKAIGKEGVELARTAAPTGPPREDYGRRAPLRTAFKWTLHGAAFVTWGIKPGPQFIHARAQETGGAPHVIEGNPNLVFYWLKRGRRVNTPRVQHPGNPALHFLEDSRIAMETAAVQIARKYFKN